jgi:YfiH family protein
VTLWLEPPELLGLAPRHRFAFGLGRVSPGEMLDGLLPKPAAGAAPAWVAHVRQVHGTDVVRVEAGSRAAALAETPADALCTALPQVALAIRTADCVPVLLADPAGGACAAAHAGWRGLAAGVLGRTVDALTALSGMPADRLVAAIGPSIGPCCFEVGDEVADAFAPTEVMRPSGGARPHVDLWAAARARLQQAGLRPERVFVAGGGARPPCTSCEAARFASYRRSTRAGRPLDGYQFSLIVQRPPALD